MSSSTRLLAPVAALLFVLLAAGCNQRIFVGMPTPIPEEVILQPVANAPVPKFGPAPFARQFENPGNAPAVVRDQLDVATGPAFAWAETENYLILGTDRRPNDSSWRTDTIIVVGVDRTLNRAAVLSIPRDLYIEIPRYGYGRINQADYIGQNIQKLKGGGPELVSEVISETLGIPTRHWVRIEMTGFQQVVDAVGGVDVYLDCPFYEPIFNLDTNAWDYFTLPAGEVHMDGETAYWYVRLRLRESDIGRARRQRQFLWALRDQALNANLVLRFPELWSAFSNSYSTDLSLIEMLDLVRFGLALDPANVRASGISLRELQSYTTEKGASVLVITDPARVMGVVDGIWSAPAMIDANRQDANKCQPIPEGVPVVQNTSPLPTPTPAPPPVADPGAAAANEPAPAGGG